MEKKGTKIVCVRMPREAYVSDGIWNEGGICVISSSSAKDLAERLQRVQDPEDMKKAFGVMPGCRTSCVTLAEVLTPEIAFRQLMDDEHRRGVEEERARLKQVLDELGLDDIVE